MASPAIPLGFRIEPRTAVMLVLFVGSVLLAWVILPGQAERIAMLERDGRRREALALLERNFADGDRRPRTLFQLQNHYEEFGDLDNARRMLEMLTELRPRDTQALRRLALFYRHTQDVEAQIGALKRLIALRYSEDACRELIGLYRQRGAYAEEQATLQDCRQKGYRRADDLIRLASLLAVDGEAGAATGLLRSADDLRRLKTEPERLRLFGILIAQDQPREALRRAVRWVRGQRNEAFVDLLVDQLLIADRADTALALVREVGSPGDAIALTVAELMLAKDQQSAARIYLRGWLENARVTSRTLAARFIRTALDADAPDIAFLGARRFGLERVPQAELALLGAALVAADRLTEAEALRPFVGVDMVGSEPQDTVRGRRPGVGARGAGAPALSEPARELEGWRLALWTRLMAVPAPGIPPTLSDVSPPGAQIRPGLTPGRARATAKILRKIGKARGARAKSAANIGGSASQGASGAGGSSAAKQ